MCGIPADNQHVGGKGYIRNNAKAKISGNKGYS